MTMLLHRAGLRQIYDKTWFAKKNCTRKLQETYDKVTTKCM